MPTKKPTPVAPSAAAYWAAHPDQAAQALSYLQRNSSDQGITRDIANHPNIYQQVVGKPPTKPAVQKGVFGLPQSPKQQMRTNAGVVEKSLITNLTAQGVDPAQAHQQLLAELMAAQAHKQKSIHATEDVTDPIEMLYKQGGDPTAEAIVKLGGTIKDPFQMLKKGAKNTDAQQALFAATFARSPQGQKALAENNPKAAAVLARTQMEQQITNSFTQIAGTGGVADQYDQYLKDKQAYDGMTTKERKAAGYTSAPTDPLTALGYTRSSLGIAAGDPVSGATIRAAQIAKLDKERASLRQLGKPGDPGFATGVPIAGTEVAKFIDKLKSAGIVGKKLAKALTSGGLTGDEAYQAYYEMLQSPDLSMNSGLQTKVANAQAATSGKALVKPTA